MRTGISLYPGLIAYDRPYADIIHEAAGYGVSRIFTSLHIPESNPAALRQDLQDLLVSARNAGMDVIADISPTTCQLLGMPTLDPTYLQELGITTARLDFGFTVEQTALWSRVMPLQLNASTVQPAYIAALRDGGADFSQIDSLHNFYPRPDTGLSESFLMKQTDWLHGCGISVGAFVPSQHDRRGPLYEGLPTVEEHRHLPTSTAIRHLAALGLDSIFLGDSPAGCEELAALAEADRDVVVLHAYLLTQDWHMQDILSHTFTSRLDGAAAVIRAQESRALFKDYPVHADASLCQERHCGDVTVDTTDFLRYMGEMQIILHDLPPEKRTNIVARIVPEDRILLPYITPGRKFRFHFVRPL